MSKKTLDLYSKEELIAGYKAFNVPKECVVAALRNIDKATKEEAMKIIQDFMKEEVR